MKKLALLFLLSGILLGSCKSSGKQSIAPSTNNTTRIEDTNDSIVYKSDLLVIQKLSKSVYVHTSFLNTNSFGRVDCNGMIVVNGAEAIVFDTPADKESTDALVQFVSDSLHATIKAIVPTHFHEDCVGGLETFLENGIPVYASNKTISILQKRNRHFSKPITGFDKRLTLSVGGKAVHAEYFGAGHTEDNIVGYFPEEKALFGGCLVKALGASEGNLEDAEVNEWPVTISRLNQKYPHTRIVIPGHGKWGGADLLQYTRKLFQ